MAGTSEVALRLPSALFGIALVPVAFAIGRRLGGQRAAVALAALVAVNPLLVYYSQEARGYAAVALACAVGFGLLPRCARGEASAVVGARLGRRARLPLLRDLPGRDRGGDPARAPRPRRAARARRRRAGRGGAAAAAGRAGRRRPHRQRDGRHGPGRAREGRRDELARGRARGGGGQPRVAGGRAAARGRGPRRAPSRAGGDPPRGGRRGRGGADGPRGAGGADYLNNRNTLPVLAIALAVPALGFAAGRRAGEALGAAACVAMAVATVGALTDPAHAREDWRATARDLGATSAVVVVPPYADVPLRWYRPGLEPAPPDGVDGDRAGRRPQRSRPQPPAARRARRSRPSRASPPRARAATTGC